MLGGMLRSSKLLVIRAMLAAPSKQALPIEQES